MEGTINNRLGLNFLTMKSKYLWVACNAFSKQNSMMGAYIILLTMFPFGDVDT